MPQPFKTIRVSIALAASLLLAASVTASSALAAPLEIVSAFRPITVLANWSYRGPLYSDHFTADDFTDSIGLGGAFVRTIEVVNFGGRYAQPSIARAGQDSHISADRFWGTGFGESQGDIFVGEYAQGEFEDVTDASAGTAFSVTFDVSHPVPFDFTASFLSGGPGPNEGTTSHRAQLTRSGDTDALFDERSHDSFDLALAGVLTPGRYSLWVQSGTWSVRATPGKSAQFAFSMVVPEPGTALLLGAGLVLIGRPARRR